MFEVNTQTGAVTMHIGDTGGFIVPAEKSNGEPFETEDRCLFTLSNAAGEIVIERVYSLDEEWPGNGKIFIEFHNSDTDSLPAGTYHYELRYVLNPYYDDGAIVDGDTVRTAMTDVPLTLLAVQKNI